MAIANWIDFSGKLCIVTGAAGGMGQAITRGFLELGARVAALDIDGDACAAFVASLDLAPDMAAGVPCDIADPAAVEAAAAIVQKRLGAADILVNNAATLGRHSLLETSFAEWNRILAVNLSGYFNCSQVFGAAMIERGSGAIVHVASIAATEPVADAGAYSSSKAGVHLLSRQIASEWGPLGIRSNTVSPGMIRTPFSEATYRRPGVEAFRTSRIPGRAIGQPQQIADAVLFLASERAGYINGGDILVDGGLSQTLMGQFPR